MPSKAILVTRYRHKKNRCPIKRENSDTKQSPDRKVRALLLARFGKRRLLARSLLPRRKMVRLAQRSDPRLFWRLAERIERRDLFFERPLARHG